MHVRTLRRLQTRRMTRRMTRRRPPLLQQDIKDVLQVIANWVSSSGLKSVQDAAVTLDNVAAEIAGFEWNQLTMSDLPRFAFASLLER